MNQFQKSPSCDAVTLTAKQANIYAWGWQSEARFRFAVCGRRFGKTHLAVVEILRAARLAVRRNIHPDHEIWYAPTRTQAKRVFWRRLKRAVPEDWRSGRPNETECSITLTSGHVVRLVGVDHYEALRGSGLWFFIGDEWADCPIAAWAEVIRPMLATSGGHALFIGTPKGFNHFYEGFAAGQPGGRPDTRSWQYSTFQGGNVPAAELATIRAELDARTFAQEYEASFETFQGRVYYGFSRLESVRPCPYDPGLPLHVGMDFNINPMSATLWQERDGALWQVDEVVIPTSNTHEMADEIARRYGRPGHTPGLGHITVYPDPAGAQRRTSAQGQTDLGILRAKGFTVVAADSHPRVRDRINLVNARFEAADGRRRAFVDPRCRQSIRCYEQLSYRDGTGEPDKEAGLDHLPDATGYYFYTRFVHKPARRVQLPTVGR